MKAGWSGPELSLCVQSAEAPWQKVRVEFTSVYTGMASLALTAVAEREGGAL